MLPLDFFLSLLISPFALGVIGYLGGRVWGGLKGFITWSFSLGRSFREKNMGGGGMVEGEKGSQFLTLSMLYLFIY